MLHWNHRKGNIQTDVSFFLQAESVCQPICIYHFHPIQQSQCLLHIAISSSAIEHVWRCSGHIHHTSGLDGNQTGVQTKIQNDNGFTSSFCVETGKVIRLIYVPFNHPLNSSFDFYQNTLHCSISPLCFTRFASFNPPLC